VAGGDGFIPIRDRCQRGISTEVGGSAAIGHDFLVSQAERPAVG
jgi:hypothetical protein